MKHDFIKHKPLLLVGFFAFLFMMLGVFLKIWWYDCNTLEMYGLWQRVSCDDGFCMTTNGDSAGFLIFTRMAGIFSIFLTAVAMLSTALFLWKQKSLLNFITGVFSIINGVSSSITVVVLVGSFHVISNAWNDRVMKYQERPPLCYNPIPLFFFIISGLASMVTALFTMMKLDNNVKRAPSFNRNVSRERTTKV